MISRVTAIAVLCAMLAPLLWAGNVITGRAFRGELDPYTLNFLRWVVASAILLPVIIRQRASIISALRSHPLPIIFLSLTGYTAFNTLQYEGLRTSPAIEAGILVGVSPVLILVIARFWGGRRLQRAEIIGGAIAFAGATIVLVGGEDALVIGSNLRGPIFLIIAALTWAVYTVGLQRFEIPLSPFANHGISSLLGAIMTAPLLFLSPVPIHQIAWSVETVTAVLYIGIFASFLAFYFWRRGVAVLGPARAGIFLQFIPVFAMVLGALILAETVHVVQVFGLVLVLVGVVVAQRMGGR